MKIEFNGTLAGCNIYDHVASDIRLKDNDSQLEVKIENSKTDILDFVAQEILIVGDSIKVTIIVEKVQVIE